MLAAPEAEAQRQHDVGAASERLLEGAANRQRMLFGDRALTGAARVDRDSGKFNELFKFRGRLGPEEPVAAGDQWTLGRVQHLDRLVDLGRVAGRAGIVEIEDLPAALLLGVIAAGIEDVLRNLDQRDALRRGHRLAEGEPHVEFDRAPVGHAFGVLREAAQDVRAVGFLEGALMVFGVGMLSRDADHCAVGHRGETQARDRVGQAAAGRDHADTGFPGHAGVGVGRVGGRLLVTHMNQFDFVTAQLRENREKMSAVDRETVTRAIFPHDPRDQFTAVRLGHRQSSLELPCGRGYHGGATPSRLWPHTGHLRRFGLAES